MGIRGCAATVTSVGVAKRHNDGEARHSLQVDPEQESLAFDAREKIRVFSQLVT